MEKLPFKLLIKNIFIGRGCDHLFGYFNLDHVKCEKCGKIKKDFNLAADLYVERWRTDDTNKDKHFKTLKKVFKKGVPPD